MIEHIHYDGNTMNNLIDRVDFIQSLKSGVDAMGVIEALLKFPPIDAKPVVRGEWVEEDDNDYRCHFLVCSRCKGEVVDKVRIRNLMWMSHMSFCPNCGADMRGEKDDTDRP